jgi:Cellulase (glycosyl hydrolase family 5)
MRTTLLCATALAICAASPEPPNPLLTLRGVNASVSDALQGWPQVQQQFPGMTIVRLNCNSGTDAAGDIAKVVQEYTEAGIAVEIEDHSGAHANTLWYAQMAAQFANNPLVLFETPNEPGGNVSADQIAVIGAIRTAGFNGPIGIQPAGGFDFSTVGPVLAKTGTANVFVTPHIYYSGSDPNGAVNYVNSDIAQCDALGVPCIIDEFGNAMDGFTMDPQGDAVMLAVIAANDGANGSTVRAGAVFWAMDNGNHTDGADSAFLTSDGSALTSTGTDVIKPWLSPPGHATVAAAPAQAQTISSDAAPATPAATAAPADLTSELAQLQAEITQLEAEVTALESNGSATPQPATTQGTPTNEPTPLDHPRHHRWNHRGAGGVADGS